MENENSNELVEKVTKVFVVNLDNQAISTSHKLYNNIPSSDLEFGLSHNEQNERPQPPALINARFANRDKRNEFLGDENQRKNAI